MEQNRRKKFAKYMPVGAFPAKRGYAFQASLSKDSKDRVRFFIEMAPQVGPKPKSGSSESSFDWKLKKFISLDDVEMGQIMACLRGRTKDVNIIHVYPMNAPPAEQKTSGLKVIRGEYNGQTNWGFQLMQKVGTASPETYQLYIQPGEAEVLMLMLEAGIRESYDI